MIYKLNLLYKEIALFAATLVLSLITAREYISGVSVQSPLAPQYDFSYRDGIYFVLIVVIFYFILMRFKTLASLMLAFFLLVVVFSGANIVFGVFLEVPWDFALAAFFTLIFVFLRNVLIHNLGIVIGLAGVGTILGLGISPLAAVMLMIFLSVYDILAVYWTRHMVYLAEGMVASGSIFGFIIPSSLKGFMVSGKEAKSRIGDNFMILGSGDVGLPVIFVSSIATVSLTDASLVALFSVLGLVATHLIFINQSARRPMAALPPIATATIIGYFITVLI